MRKLIIVSILAFLGWQGYHANNRDSLASEDFGAEFREDDADEGSDTKLAGSSGFACDGRTHCSQMRSCAEATWFINNCPGTEMDGNHDGVPCERQWCSR